MKLIRKVCLDCPICGKMHEVEERKEITTTIIKGEEVAYEERYYFCPDAKDTGNGFETGEMLNENLSNARMAYQKKKGKIL